MPRHERARLLLRGATKRLVIVLLAGSVGVGLGLGLAALLGDDDLPRPATTASAPAGNATTPAGSFSTPPTTPTPSLAPADRTAPASPPAVPPDPRRQLRVSVGPAVLHPAASASGQRRQRARLGVRLELANLAAEPVTPARPVLLAAGERVATDPRQDAPDTHIGPLAPGATAGVTLRFETSGAVTEQLTTQRQARILVAGRMHAVRVTIGERARPSGSGSG
ncbi:MAG: hypothetical protein Q8O56_06930 [Solirubrobacteraceae bacterium]|nr:hypothetical protein [Solirubrobacteraceae bacterium]